MILSITKQAFGSGRKLCVYHNDIEPARKTLFFIHGLQGSSKNFQAQFRAFSSRYNIVAYDLAGHGQSSLPKKYAAYTLTESLADATGIIEHFKLENISIIAYGYGALISLLLCDHFPKLIMKQLLINPRIYERKKCQSWYLHRPFSWLYQFYGRNKNRLASLGNNSLYFPKVSVLGAYDRALMHLPDRSKSKSKIKAKTRVLRSVYLPVKQRNRIDHFYRIFYRAKVKPLESDARFPMIQAAERVNHFIQQYIDELNTRAFRNLVFEGAGIRGIAYAGAITALESLGILHNIHRFAGTSSGAIYAIFLAVGYKAREIEEIVRNIDYKGFTDASRNFIRNSTRLLTDYGWYKGDAFVDYMGHLIAGKLEDGEINFAMLKARTGNDLYIVGTNLSKSCAEVYSAETTPDMKLIEAIRISTSIPMFFKAIKRKEDKKENILVDGALAWNCPLEIFDRQKYIYNRLNAFLNKATASEQETYLNWETLGFRLDPLHDPLHAMREPGPYRKISHIFDFTREFMKFYSAGSLKQHLSPHDWQRVVFIDTLDVGGTDFAISQQNIDRLIEQGKSGVYKHFAWRMSENGLKFPQ